MVNTMSGLNNYSKNSLLLILLFSISNYQLNYSNGTSLLQMCLPDRKCSALLIPLFNKTQISFLSVVSGFLISILVIFWPNLNQIIKFLKNNENTLNIFNIYFLAVPDLS